MSIILTLLVSSLGFTFSSPKSAPPVLPPMSKSHGIAHLNTQTKKMGSQTRLIVTVTLSQESTTPYKINWLLPEGVKSLQPLSEQTFESHPGKTHEFSIDLQNYYDVPNAFVTFEITGTVNDHRLGSTAVFFNQEAQSLEVKMMERSETPKKRPVLQK